MNFNILIVLVMFLASIKLIFMQTINESLLIYKHLIYKIHPLVLVTKHGMNSDGLELLQQDQLDENESFNGKLNKNQNMALYCSGYSNYLAMTKKDEISAELEIPENSKRGEKLSKTVFEKDKIYQARCLSPMLAIILVPVREKLCASGRGVLIQSGFEMYEKGSIFKSGKKVKQPLFLPLYDICFDKITMLPLYTTHQLVKSKLLYKEVILSDMPMNRFARDLMVLKFDRASYYPAQLEIKFRYTFGKAKSKMLLKMFEDRNGQALLPYRLTPAGDFFYKPVKVATFMYENSIPVFSTICDGNLKKVELLGRILAAQLNRSLKVVNGSFGLLKLKDENKVQQILYIDRETDGKIVKRYRPVSKHIYRIYYDTESKGGIVFVTLNNPYVPKDDKIYLPCDNILRQFMDVNLFFDPDPKAGITVCCTIKNLLLKQPILNSHLKDFKFGEGVLSLDIFNNNFPMDFFDSLNNKKRSVKRETSKFLDSFNISKAETSS